MSGVTYSFAFCSLTEVFVACKKFGKDEINKVPELVQYKRCKVRTKTRLTVTTLIAPTITQAIRASKQFVIGHVFFEAIVLTLVQYLDTIRHLKIVFSP